MRGRILVAGGAPNLFDSLVADLRERGFQVESCGTAARVLDRCASGDADVVLASAALPDATGAELCTRLASLSPEIRVILVGEDASYDRVLAALRAGAFDFFASPDDVDAVELAILRALRRKELKDEVKRLRVALIEAAGFEELVGASQPMQQLYELLERAALTSSTVLISGESGTGKELVARALHRRSRRSSGPFVAINCSAIPENLLESELFGHVKGAFTDAHASRPGLFVGATGGTIFLDEIGEMPLSLQPKLLRALQERAVRPVGGDGEIAFDARVIAATNRNLEAAVADKSFREDLFYRLSVIPLSVPPLRERASDVLLIAQHFVEHYAIHAEKDVVGLAPGAAETILGYPWPGNVRELQNCIERAVALTRHREIEIEDLPEKIRSYRRSHVLVVSEDPSELVTMEEVEKRYIARVLHAVGGNKREAARILGFDRKTLYRKLQRYGIEAPRRSDSRSRGAQH